MVLSATEGCVYRCHFSFQENDVNGTLQNGIEETEQNKEKMCVGQNKEVVSTPCQSNRQQLSDPWVGIYTASKNKDSTYFV